MRRGPRRIRNRSSKPLYTNSAAQQRFNFSSYCIGLCTLSLLFSHDSIVPIEAKPQSCFYTGKRKGYKAKSCSTEILRPYTKPEVCFCIQIRYTAFISAGFFGSPNYLLYLLLLSVFSSITLYMFTMCKSGKCFCKAKMWIVHEVNIKDVSYVHPKLVHQHSTEVFSNSLRVELILGRHSLRFKFILRTPPPPLNIPLSPSCYPLEFNNGSN